MVPEFERYRNVLRAELPRLRTEFGVASLALFGSVVRCEQRAESDLDILVEFCVTPGLIGYLELENHLTDLLGRKVDLVLTGALKPRIRSRILAERLPV